MIDETLFGDFPRGVKTDIYNRVSETLPRISDINVMRRGRWNLRNVPTFVKRDYIIGATPRTLSYGHGEPERRYEEAEICFLRAPSSRSTLSIKPASIVRRTFVKLNRSYLYLYPRIFYARLSTNVFHVFVETFCKFPSRMDS